MATADLFLDIVLVLLAALAGAALAARLGQSVILGFILAGIVVGPNTPGFVGDAAAVAALADIGIILLMFAIGVQFSLRDLLRAGRVATLGSTVQVVVTIGLGYAVGLALGWRPLEAAFFGAVLSNSSSTVLSKVLGERGELGSPQGRIALAWSTLQDLGTVVLVVLLSALAGGGDNLFTALLRDVGRALLFLVIVVPVGWFALPRVFDRAAALRSREVFILTVAVVALGTAYLAAQFGLSLALGAFLAGIVVGESDLSHEILGQVLPLRDIFAGLFFVSVGMLVDPGFVLGNIPTMALTVGLIIVAKGVLVISLAIMLSLPLRTAVLSGAALAQCGEFSFLLARVGSDLAVVSSTVFSLMLAGSALSIVLHPTVYRAAGPLAAALGRRRPEGRTGLEGDGPEDEPSAAPRGHAILCGYGRVGRIIGSALRQRGLRFVVVEEDPRIVQELRTRGLTVIQGNAGNPVLLDRLGLARARALIVAVPDAVVTRQIIDHARRASPRLDIIVRTHSEAEAAYLLRRGIGEAVLGELETALEMTRHTLHRFGVSTQETGAMIQGLRGRVLREPPHDTLGPVEPPTLPADRPPSRPSISPAVTPPRPARIRRSRPAGMTPALSGTLDTPASPSSVSAEPPPDQERPQPPAEETPEKGDAEGG